MSIGTPDYTRGVVSAQKLLATVGAGVTSVDVGVPPNTETLVVLSPTPTASTTVTCTGKTTGVEYTGAYSRPTSNAGGNPSFMFDVCSALDDQVTIAWTIASVDTWYVYADAAARIVNDVAPRLNYPGAQYVTPMAPDTVAGDHPPVELSCTSNTFAAAGTLIPAPGAGQRVRLFAAQLMNYGTAGAWRLYDSSDTVTYLTCAESRSAEIAYPLTGVTLPANNALYCTLVTGGGSCRAMATYTVENV